MGYDSPLQVGFTSVTTIYKVWVIPSNGATLGGLVATTQVVTLGFFVGSRLEKNLR